MARIASRGHAEDGQQADTGQPVKRRAHRLTRQDIELALIDINKSLEPRHLRIAVEWQGKQGLHLVQYRGREVIAANLTKQAAMTWIQAYVMGLKEGKEQDGLK